MKKMTYAFIICLILSLMGIAYSQWQEEIDIALEINTGRVQGQINYSDGSHIVDIEEIGFTEHYTVDVERVFQRKKGEEAYRIKIDNQSTLPVVFQDFVLEDVSVKIVVEEKIVYHVKEVDEDDDDDEDADADGDEDDGDDGEDADDEADDAGAESSHGGRSGTCSDDDEEAEEKEPRKVVETSTVRLRAPSNMLRFDVEVGSQLYEDLDVDAYIALLEEVMEESFDVGERRRVFVTERLEDVKDFIRDEERDAEARAEAEAEEDAFLRFKKLDYDFDCAKIEYTYSFVERIDK